jgi:UDP-N-acetylmuramate--alanine ligase
MKPTAGAELGRVHFVGIGGAGMSGIARILLARGVPVSGSDARESATSQALRYAGATVHIGHTAGNVSDVDTVVVSTAIRDANPEVVEAHRRGLRVLRRAAALAAVMAGRRGIAVAGTHGKTSTTSMLVTAAQACGADPAYAIGGDLISTAGPDAAGVNAADGTGGLFIAEADESDGSFLLLSPYAAVVTNVEADHLDQHGTAEQVAIVFEQFARRIDPDGFLVWCADDPGARRTARAAADAGLRTRSYGLDAGDLRLTELAEDAAGTAWRPVLDGTPLPPVRLPVPGRHMALNSAAALLTGLELGLPAAGLAEGIGRYAGVRRRFERRGEAGGVTVYDDYAHHPTEVAAQLRAARTVAGASRVLVAFQPHLFSRTVAFAADFGAALGLADEVVVLDVYGAREDPVPGVTGALVADAVPLPADRVVFAPDRGTVVAELAHRARPGDLVITMGAGDVTALGPEILAALTGSEARR